MAKTEAEKKAAYRKYIMTMADTQPKAVRATQDEFMQGDMDRFYSETDEDKRKKKKKAQETMATVKPKKNQTLAEKVADNERKGGVAGWEMIGE